MKTQQRLQGNLEKVSLTEEKAMSHMSWPFRRLNRAFKHLWDCGTLESSSSEDLTFGDLDTVLGDLPVHIHVDRTPANKFELETLIGHHQCGTVQLQFWGKCHHDLSVCRDLKSWSQEEMTVIPSRTLITGYKNPPSLIFLSPWHFQSIPSNWPGNVQDVRTCERLWWSHRLRWCSHERTGLQSPRTWLPERRRRRLRN